MRIALAAILVLSSVTGLAAQAPAPAAAAAPLQTYDVPMTGTPQTVYILRRTFAPGERLGAHTHPGAELTVVISGDVEVIERGGSAKVYHTIYSSFLQRYTDVMQQQSFPITEARVISPAAPPSHRSKPNRPLTMAIAVTMGLILSLGAAALREANSKVVRLVLPTQVA